MRVRFGVVAAVLTIGLGGCAPTPTLRNVLAKNYRGYDQLLPASGILPDEGRYQYLPGNVIALEPTEPRSFDAAAVWSEKSSIYCPINIPLSALKSAKARDAYVLHDFDLSLRRTLGFDKAKADLRLEDNEIEVLRRVEISVSSARTYRLHPGQKPNLSSECLAAIAGRPDLYRLRTILAGDVHVKILFKENVSLVAKLVVANKIKSNLGFGFLNGVAQGYDATNMVFAAKVSPTKVPPTPAPLTASLKTASPRRE
jgi:hypothetical protein